MYTREQMIMNYCEVLQIIQVAVILGENLLTITGSFLSNVSLTKRKRVFVVVFILYLGSESRHTK